MKTLNQILNVIIGSFVGVFIGHSLFVVYEYNKYPEMYAMQSAPWYTSILLYGAGTLVISLIAIVIKIAIKKHLQKDSKEQK